MGREYNQMKSEGTSYSVMLLIDLLGPMGGAERNLNLLARGLRERGVKVIVCALQGGRIAKEMQADGFRVEDLGLAKIYGFQAIKSLWKMIKVIRKEKISLIMSYHESSDYLGILVGLLARVSVVSSRRDMGFKLKPRHIWMYRLINWYFDQITTVSSAVKEAVVNTQWGKPSDIVVIHNGVDTDMKNGLSLIEGTHPEMEDGCLNICYVANIRPIKGHEHLISSADLVIQKFPKVRFSIVGAVADVTYKRKIEDQIKVLGLEDMIKFIGELPPTQIPSFLSFMDIVISPSLSEGMSNALLEAMNAGKPVVATAVGGNSELVKHNKTGYLVPPGDPQALAEALLRLLMNPELRHGMGLQGQSFVQTELSAERMVDRYEDLFRYVYLIRKLGRWRRYASKVKKMAQQIKSYIKISISRIFYHSGLWGLLRQAKRALNVGSVKIFCFHDISETEGRRVPFSISINPKYFSEVINFLAQNYQVVSLEKAVHLLETDQHLKDDVFALTFDDCYKGWIMHVLPECQRLRVPYAVFLTVDPLDSGMPLLYDSLIYLAENTWRKVADLSYWQLGVFLLEAPEDIFNFVEKLHESWRGKSKEKRNQFLQELADYLGVSLNSEKLRNRLPDWDDVRKMDDEGVTVGAHSMSHNCLHDLAEEDCFWEVIQSKKRLEVELGHSVNYFAYPYGVFDYRKRDTTKMVQGAGFRYAFTLNSYKQNRFLPYQIPRHGVSHGMFVGLNGKFSKALLATELSGFGNFLFGRLFMRKKTYER